MRAGGLQGHGRNTDRSPKGARLACVEQRAVGVGEDPCGYCHSLSGDWLRVAQAVDHRFNRALGIEDSSSVDEDHPRASNRRPVGLGNRTPQATRERPTAAVARELGRAQRELVTRTGIRTLRQRAGQFGAQMSSANP